MLIKTATLEELYQEAKKQERKRQKTLNEIREQYHIEIPLNYDQKKGNQYYHTLASLNATKKTTITTKGNKTTTKEETIIKEVIVKPEAFENTHNLDELLSIIIDHELIHARQHKEEQPYWGEGLIATIKEEIGTELPVYDYQLWMTEKRKITREFKQGLINMRNLYASPCKKIKPIKNGLFYEVTINPKNIITQQEKKLTIKYDNGLMSMEKTISRN